MGKRVAIISGVVTLAVICAGLLWSREFAVRYHVYRMRLDVDYLLRAIESPEGTIAGEAVRRICASGEFPGTGLIPCVFRWPGRGDRLQEPPWQRL